MKRTRILWGVALLAAAILLLLNAFGVTLGLPTDIPLWRILLALLCATWLVNELLHLRIPGIFFPLIFIIMLFEKEIAHGLGIADGDLASAWVFLLIALLLTVGSAILLPKRLWVRLFTKKHKKNHIGHNQIRYVDCTEPFSERIENNMGSCEVYFSNADQYGGNGSLRVENNMGQVVLHVPKGWCVISSIENNMGSVQIPHGRDSGMPLTVTGENNMGCVRVVYEK
ncbi:MAG: hypothetical protein IJW44_01710 [Clostridia bacterium]|nr:hypothetical protein [Clostridia bacterium]